MDEIVGAPMDGTGSSEMGRLIREHDWAATPLGPMETWPDRLKVLVDTMLAVPQAMWIGWGPELIQIYNDGYRALLDAERHEAALGRPAAETWADNWQVVGPMLTGILEGGPAVSHADRRELYRHEGALRERYFSFSFSPIADLHASRGVGGVLCMAVETTPAVQLRVGEARLQSVLGGMGEAFGLMDRDFRILTFNEAALRLETRPLEEIVGRTHWEVYPGSEESEIGRLYKSALAENRPVFMEHRYTWEDGHARWLEMRAFPVPEGLAVFWRDITERKEAEAERQALAQRNAEVLESISDAFYAVDRDWRFTYINHETEKWWGRSREDLLGKVYWEEFPQALGSEPYKAHLRAAETREVVRLETISPILHHWVDISIFPTPDGGLSVYFRDISDRKRAEAERAEAEVALRESEARFRLMADAVPQIVWITDPEGRTEFFNKQWTDYTGAPYEPTTAAGIAASFVHPEDGPATVAAFDEARRTGSTFLVEHRIRSKAGDWRWFLVRGVPYRDPRTGAITRWFGASLDIHDRKLAEERLRESEARLRLATEAAEVGFWDVDPVKDELVWPPRVKAMFGISPDRPVSMRDFYAGLHPDDREATTAAFTAALDPNQRALYDVEYRTIGKEDGRLRWVAAKGRGLFDEAGRCIRVIGTAIDITARKAVEERLRELNETLERRVSEALAERNMLAKLVELTDVMVMAVDLDYNILALNAANADEFERIYGVRPKAGDNMLELLADQPEHQEQVRAGWALGMRGEQVTFVEDFGDPDRVRPYYQVNFRPLRNDEGEQIGVYQFVIDVTERLRKEAQLTEAQEQLRQAQKMEAMGQLTGGVAHDFNNLLTPIVASLDILQRRGLGSAREQRLIEGAAQAAERAKTLVQRLLAFARRQPLQPTAVDLADLVGGMAGLVSSTTGPQIRVAVEVEDDLPPAKADPNQLEMALLNLAVNARDAMPEGGTLRITAAAEEVQGQAAGRLKLKPGSYVRLSVADTGVGMDDATLARAVEPFFSTKGVGKGTGLGLSMVHGLASQLGGALAIHSRPGLGTNVELWLPQSESRPEVTHHASKLDAGQRLGTALLVDDEEVVRLSTAELLEDLGYQVLEADSAEAALRLVEADRPLDLLVTDHLMPGMNGSDLARRLRAMRPGLPVLIISGYAESEGIEPDLPRLSKPFRKDELELALAELMSAGSA